MATWLPISLELPCLPDNKNGGANSELSLKFSYHNTIYPKYYPKELGSNFPSRLIKDYNGQTYWLSFNIKSFLSAKNDFPAWLNMSVGYGAEGMMGASRNPEVIDGKTIPSFPTLSAILSCA